jgi:cation-transporting ATPase E
VTLGATMTETKSQGLSAAEVAERVAAGRTNRVRRSDAAEYLDIVARNVLTLFNALVVPAALALLLLGEVRGGLAVSGMALTNTVLGLFQEVRAKRHLDRLALLAEARARVVRDGIVADVPSGDVVQGDLVLLAAGETVVADGAVETARFLEVDEALLTGESDPVPRRPGEQVLSGSFCVAGEGSYRADRVGAEAFAQKTANEARAYRYAASPLQQSINRLLRILTYTAVALCALYVVLWSRRGFSDVALVEMIAATITSMVPQGLVLMATLAFVLGAVRMAARGAVVQRLNAVESMAAIDTVCMDKTGTLTTNRLRLERLALLTGDVPEAAVRERLRLFASSSVDRGSKSLAAVRDALGEAAAELLDQIPFKSQNRYSAVRLRSGAAEYVLVLGAPEALRPFVAGPKSDGWETSWQELMRTGLRLLLFAEAEAPGGRRFEGSLEGLALRPLALVALSDELRPEAPAVLESLAGQGVRFKIVSGDNPETVRATMGPLAEAAPAVRYLAEGPVVTGAELADAADPTALVRDRAVFGRVSPWQKVEVVQSLRRQGRHVAMVGDGVNDVLPIKNADLGVAMGEGSRASKTVAGLVLETNDFGLLPQTLDEGRTILRNLRRASKLFLVKNVFTLLLIVAALGVFHLPFPFLPQQVTLLNFLTIGMPAVLITLSKERAATGGRSSGAARLGFLPEVGLFALRTGVVLGVAGVAMMLLAEHWWQREQKPAATDSDLAQYERTMLLSVLILLGSTTLLRVLRDGEARRVSGDFRFEALAVGAVPVYLVAMYWQPVAYFFELEPLGLPQWGRVLGIAVTAYAVTLLTDVVQRRLGW